MIGLAYIRCLEMENKENVRYSRKRNWSGWKSLRQICRRQRSQKET